MSYLEQVPHPIESKLTAEEFAMVGLASRLQSLTDCLALMAFLRRNELLKHDCISENLVNPIFGWCGVEHAIFQMDEFRAQVAKRAGELKEIVELYIESESQEAPNA